MALAPACRDNDKERLVGHQGAQRVSLQRFCLTEGPTSKRDLPEGGDKLPAQPLESLSSVCLSLFLPTSRKHSPSALRSHLAVLHWEELVLSYLLIPEWLWSHSQVSA